MGENACTPAGAGANWKFVVSQVDAWLSLQSYDWQIAVAGGDDVEPGFGTPTPSLAFMDAYSAASPYERLENFGSADGCPTSGTASCINGWTLGNVEYGAWNGPNYPLPQIYTTNGAQARQWANIRQQYQIYFDGALSDYASSDLIPAWGAPCYDNQGALVNDDTEAWGANPNGSQGLWTQLGNYGVSQGSLPFLTNIRWN